MNNIGSNPRHEGDPWQSAGERLNPGEVPIIAAEERKVDVSVNMAYPIVMRLSTELRQQMAYLASMAALQQQMGAAESLAPQDQSAGVAQVDDWRQQNGAYGAGQTGSMTPQQGSSYAA